jgi:hypothetical protein
MHLSQGAPVDGEILCKGKDFTTVDFAVSGYDTIAWNNVLIHVEVATTMFNEGINLLECAFIEQHVKTFTSRHLSSIVLRINASLATASLASSLSSTQIIETLFRR